MTPEHRIEVLERQVIALRREVRMLHEWHDTVKSPLWRRVWWWLLGYRFDSLGTWYAARWNCDGQEYD